MLRKLYYAVADRLGLLLGQRDDCTPPQRLIGPHVDGSRDLREYVWIGEATIQALIEGGLRPDHKVLEVGCASGKMAWPLTHYLSAEGGYDGFDPDAACVAWCQKTIHRRFPNFRFQHADVYDKDHNPAGKRLVSDYQFPYPDATFDWVVLYSVFTHMLPEGVENYFAQIARVLKPGGWVNMSFYLLNKKTLANMNGFLRQRAEGLFFDHPVSKVCRAADPQAPENLTAYDEAYVRGLCARHGLEVQVVWYGRWAERDDAIDSYQDGVAATKKRIEDRGSRIEG